jgi:hypothetical protein
MKCNPSYLAAGLAPRGRRGVSDLSRGASPAAKWSFTDRAERGLA